MDDLYVEEILDHYKNPRNQGTLSPANERQTLLHIHAANAGCGDLLDIDLLFENDTLVDIKWRGVGCAISQASMSVASEWMLGKSKQELKHMSQTELTSLLGLETISIARQKCLCLPLHFLQEL